MYLLHIHSPIYRHQPARLGGVIGQKFTIWAEAVLEQDVFRPNSEVGVKCWRLLQSKELHSPYSLLDISMVVKSGRITWAAHAERMGNIRHAYFGQHERKRPFRRLSLERATWPGFSPSTFVFNCKSTFHKCYIFIYNQRMAQPAHLSPQYQRTRY
jgi:hypothetical protein